MDGEIGAAGSTGRGEANLFSLASFLVVEGMRKGLHPKDAGLEALRRIRSYTIEKRLLNARGLPNFDLNFYVLDAKGQYAGVSIYQSNFAVCTENGPQTLMSRAAVRRPVEGLRTGQGMGARGMGDASPGPGSRAGETPALRLPLAAAATLFSVS